MADNNNYFLIIINKYYKLIRLISGNEKNIIEI